MEFFSFYKVLYKLSSFLFRSALFRGIKVHKLWSFVYSDAHGAICALTTRRLSKPFRSWEKLVCWESNLTRCLGKDFQLKKINRKDSKNFVLSVMRGRKKTFNEKTKSFQKFNPVCDFCQKNLIITQKPPNFRLVYAMLKNFF